MFIPYCNSRLATCCHVHCIIPKRFSAGNTHLIPQIGALDVPTFWLLKRQRAFHHGINCFSRAVIWNSRKKEKKKESETMQAAKSSSHQLRKRGHLGRKAPSLEKKRGVSEDQEGCGQTSQQTSPDWFEGGENILPSINAINAALELSIAFGPCC